MQTNAIPASAPGDPAPTSEEPAPIKMTNQQHYKLDQATPVRTVATAHFPTAACTKNCAPSPQYSSTRALRDFPRQKRARFTCCKPNLCTSLTCAASQTCSVPLARQALQA